VSLEADVGYVGFEATPELAEGQLAIRLRPTVVADAHKRPEPRPIVAALRGARASFYFYDNNIHIQPTGFWNRRGRRASLLITRHGWNTEPASTVRLRTHCGLVANTVQIASGTSKHSIQLRPSEARELELPTSNNRVQIDVASADGFVPADIDTASRDPRDLGCWVEVLEWLP
jgi:hypothetical protein